MCNPNDSSYHFIFLRQSEFLQSIFKNLLPIHCFHLKSLKTLGVLFLTLEKHEMIMLFS